MNNKFYVTTPIYYPTAKPHLGSLYSTVLADVAARWSSLSGKKEFFLTGTDEHGQKIAQAAHEAGKTPKDFVDGFIDSYKKVWSDYNIKYSRFIRTTDSDHVHGVQVWISELIKKGDVYKDVYEGLYCVPCETFFTEKDIDKQNPVCLSCGRALKSVQEECYFFRLSKYQEKLLAFYKNNPNFVTPKERLNEVIKFVESGLKDLSISRTTVSWGIPFPGDEKHVTYVWADALNNYITGVGYPENMKEFNFWWPADLQILGKDILRFHAVYWPAFLMAMGFELPKKLLVHGWIKVDNQKMSKSLGNVVDPVELEQQFGADAVRYYLVSQLSIAQDSNFSTHDLIEKINADLVNNLSNLLNRSVQLSIKNNILLLDKMSLVCESSKKLKKEFDEFVNDYSNLMNEYNFHQACSAAISYLSKVNAYFHENAPWKLKDNEVDKFKEVIYSVFSSLVYTSKLLSPIMPKKMEEIQRSLGIYELKSFDWNNSFKIVKSDIIFKKIENNMLKPEEVKVQEEVVKDDSITIDDFAKVDLRVGTIKSCEAVENSDKLLKLIVDFGEDLGERQILSGVKKFFAPDDLVSRQAVFVVNLKPRKMAGLESHGMMLSVTDANGNLKILSTEGLVPSGSKLK